MHIRRHRIEKPDGRFYEPRDFAVGGNVAMYGRTFHITDADAFTRGFLQDQVGAPSMASPPSPHRYVSLPPQSCPAEDQVDAPGIAAEKCPWGILQVLPVHQL